MMTLSVLNNFTSEGARAGLALLLTLFISGALAVFFTGFYTWVKVKGLRARGLALQKSLWSFLMDNMNFVCCAAYLLAVLIAGVLALLFVGIYSAL